MGLDLEGAIERKIERHVIGAWVRKNMQQIKDAIVWLNAKPGRKRGIGCVIFMVSCGLRYLGHTDTAQAFSALEQALQHVEVGMDVTGWLVGLIALLHAKARSDAEKAAA